MLETRIYYKSTIIKISQLHININISNKEDKYHKIKIKILQGFCKNSKKGVSKHSQAKRSHLHQVNFINKEISKLWTKIIQMVNYQITSLKQSLPSHHYNINLYLVEK